MATIFVPVEVPDDEVSALLGRIGMNMLGGVEVAPAIPVQAAPVQSVQADPWTGAVPPTAPAPQAAQPAAPPQGFTPQGGSAPVMQPTCAHGPMRYVPAGVSNAGRAYGAFWGCPQPRNAPDQCKSVKA